MKCSAVLSLLLCAGVLGLAAAASAQPPPADADKGKAAYDMACVACHDSSQVDMAHKTAAEWKKTVDEMREMGAAVDDAQAALITDYLARTHP